LDQNQLLANTYQNKKLFWQQTFIISNPHFHATNPYGFMPVY